MMNGLIEFSKSRKSPFLIGTALKLMYFTYNFSISLLQPFFSIMLRTIKFSTFEIGIITVIGTIGGVVLSLGITALADKIKRHKLLQVVFTILAIFFLTLPVCLLKLKIGEPTLEEKAYAKLFPNSTEDTITNPKLFTGKSAFWFIFFFFALHNSCDVTTKCLMETVTYGTIRNLKEVDGLNFYYSNQRIFLSFGSGFAGIITGLIVDILRFNWPVEYLLVSLAAFFAVVEIMCVSFVLPDFNVEEKKKNHGKILDLMRNWDLNMLLLSNTVYNITIGTIKTFDPLYIIELGGNRIIVGICFCVGYLSDIATMKISPMLITLMGGPKGVIPVGMFLYTMRSIFYAYADSEYMAIECSMRNGISYGLLWPTFSNHIHDLAPRPLVNTYLSVLFSVGKIGSMGGSLIGGILIDKIGFRYTILVIAGISGVWLLVATLYYLIQSVKKRRIGSCLLNESPNSESMVSI